MKAADLQPGRYYVGGGGVTVRLIGLCLQTTEEFYGGALTAPPSGAKTTVALVELPDGRKVTWRLNRLLREAEWSY